MPVCPGCEQRISHDELPVHQRYCAGIWMAEGEADPTVQRLCRQFIDMQQYLDERVEAEESRTDRDLLEERVDARSSASGE